MQNFFSIPFCSDVKQQINTNNEADDKQQEAIKKQKSAQEDEALENLEMTKIILKQKNFVLQQKVSFLDHILKHCTQFNQTQDFDEFQNFLDQNKVKYEQLLDTLYEYKEQREVQQNKINYLVKTISEVVQINNDLSQHNQQQKTLENEYIKQQNENEELKLKNVYLKEELETEDFFVKYDASCQIVNALRLENQDLNQMSRIMHNKLSLKSQTEK